MATKAPEATLLRREGLHVFVHCPYCRGEHQHLIYGSTHDRRTRRAPGCGSIRSQDQRMTGYWITLN